MLKYFVFLSKVLSADHSTGQTLTLKECFQTSNQELILVAVKLNILPFLDTLYFSLKTS